MRLANSTRPIICSFLITFLFSFLAFSCTSARSIVRFDEERSRIAASYKSLQRSIAIVNTQIANAKGNEQIDDTTRTEILQIVSTLQSKIDHSLDSIQQVSYKDGGMSALRIMQKDYKAFDDQVQMLSDNLLLGKLSRIATVVIFPSGKYSLSDTALNGLQAVFPKLFEEINKQLLLYPKIKKEVLFSIAGYTDAQSVITGSDVYKELAAQLPANYEISAEIINKQLSAARAKAVKGLYP